MPLESHQQSEDLEHDLERRLGERADSMERNHQRIEELLSHVKTLRRAVAYAKQNASRNDKAMYRSVLNATEEAQ